LTHFVVGTEVASCCLATGKNSEKRVLQLATKYLRRCSTDNRCGFRVN